jgi:hypothetical protein
VQLELTPAGRRLIEDVFPRFNAGESALVSGLSPRSASCSPGSCAGS